MSQERILHVGVLDKFIAPFIEFLAAQHDFERHSFFFYGDEARFAVQRRANVFLPSGFRCHGVYLLALLKAAYKSKKIMVHGLFDIRLVIFLFLQPWLLKKCYWFIWGGDLYSFYLGKRTWRNRRNELFRRFVIRRMGHLVTYVSGDVDLARKLYGASGRFHECLMYPSNVCKHEGCSTARHEGINILVGNSASPTNRHREIFEKLLQVRDQEMRVLAPLSYGDRVYAAEVVLLGRAWFGEKFLPLMDFMPLEQYLELLAEIDVVIFNHNRQQGMGNLISLLGYGKKVFMRNGTTAWDFFHSIGVTVYDVERLNMAPFDPVVQAHNCSVIRRRFSGEVLAGQLKTLFEA